MKKGLLWLVTICLFFSGCATFGSSSSELDRAIANAAKIINSLLNEGARIAVVSFDSPSERLSEYSIDELNAQLSKEYKFDLVERQYLDLVRKELNFQLSDEVSEESAQSIGKMLGAQYIITGSFQRADKVWKMRTTTIHVETAKKEAVTSDNINVNDKGIDYLLRNATPEDGRNKNTSPFDGIWRTGVTLWTFDNNNFMLELEHKIIMSGTFTYNSDELHITIYRYKESKDYFWNSFEEVVYGSFQYVIKGDRIFIKGYFNINNEEINTVLER
jgi:TolB-like protein